MWQRRVFIPLLITSLPCIGILLSPESFDYSKEAGIIWQGLITSALSVYLLVVLAENLSRLWMEYLLVLGSFLLTLLLAEGVLRFTHPYLAYEPFSIVSSPKLHHRLPRKSKMFDGIYRGVPVVIESNEDSLRSSCSRQDFLQNDKRVAFLGDSFVMGIGVNEQESLPRFLERKLGKGTGQGGDLGVLNCGVISYSPLLSRKQYEEHVRDYEPHLVLFLLDASDIGNDRLYKSQWSEEKGRFFWRSSEYEKRRLRNWGALWRLAHPYLKPLLIEPLLLVRDGLSYLFARPKGHRVKSYEERGFNPFAARNPFFIYKESNEVTEAHMRTSLREVLKLREMVEKDGSRFLFVLSPRYHHWSKRACPNNWERIYYGDDEKYEYEYLKFFLREYPDKEGMIDLLPLFLAQGARADSFVFSDDPHWNSRGNEFVATCIARYIESHNLLKEGK
mgnify:CR=1 FL=1